MAYRTPGVYVEEISTLPPSVAAVSTAVPAFLGYTEKGPSAKESPRVVRVDTLLEFENIFGGANPSRFIATTNADSAAGIEEVTKVKRDTSGTDFILYYGLTMYFNNGGGSCYIVSIGNYTDTPAKEHFTEGLAALEKEDEPTLILLTDAVNLGSEEDPFTDYYGVCQSALDQCDKLGDRFVILDVKDGKVDDFRGKAGQAAIVVNNLMYGAAYTPYLRTSLNHHYLGTGVTLEGKVAVEPTPTWEGLFGEQGIVISYTGATDDPPKAQISIGASAETRFTISQAGGPKLKVNDVKDGESDILTGRAVVEAWKSWKGETGNDPLGFDLSINGMGDGAIRTTGASNEALIKTSAPNEDQRDLESVKETHTALYNQIKLALTRERVVLPPSMAVAGVYARVDRERGVWKAPANEGLSSVIGPVTKITNAEQDSLNIDPAAGKSINAIRAFTGKGTLVWGARTLAGNDNEWRYIPVRRLFNTIEESTRKATSFAVFEPNDSTTWLKVKAMIESYLYGLWEQGALAGPTSEAAYFVNVGLGKTMTPQDVLEGRMIVEIGVAAVRPAEFVILRFTHKLQEA